MEAEITTVDPPGDANHLKEPIRSLNRKKPRASRTACTKMKESRKAMPKNTGRKRSSLFAPSG